MQVNRFNFALKWALILGSISLISSSPMLLSSSEDGMQNPSFLSAVLSILSFIAQFVIATIAIIKYARANDNRVTPGDVWTFGGILFLMVVVINLLIMGIAFSLKGGMMAEMANESAGIGIMFGTVFFMLMMSVLFFLVIPMLLAGQWRTYEKGGKPGWACLIPIYNMVCIAEMGKQPTWWVIFLFIPLVNIVFAILLLNAMVKAFGKDAGWTVGLLFLPFVFYPMLAWGDARHEDAVAVDDGLSMEDHLVE